MLVFPLALFFDTWVAFYKRWPAVFSAVLVIIVVFGLWDVWKTDIGVWPFNPRYAGT